LAPLASAASAAAPVPHNNAVTNAAPAAGAQKW
jgi:hypothetical protein